LFVGCHAEVPFNSGVARRVGGTGRREREVVWNQRKKVENCCDVSGRIRNGERTSRAAVC
jgi:hypothetical protein